MNSEPLEIWERSKAILTMGLHSPAEVEQLERYLSMIVNVSLEDGTLTITTSNSFSADLLRDSYQQKIEQALILAGADQNTRLEITYDKTVRTQIIVPEPQSGEKSSAKSEPKKVITFTSTMPLREEYTFDEFVQGPSNCYAHAAAMAVADKPGTKGYNPLFIHGGTGLGKTHLMQAIGNELIKKGSSISVCYLTAEVLLNEFVNAIQNSTMDQFRNRYRNIDVLMVDDIQFIATKNQLQDEFFNTFQSLYNAGKEIVMTCDVAPKDLHGFEKRLISRFEGGMVVEIEMPSYETRLAILRRKAEQITPTVPDNALKFIAENIKSHVRAMEGALGKVNVMMRINPALDTTDAVMRNLLNDLIEKENKIKNITVEDIQKTVCEKYACTMQELLSKDRPQSIVTPRQVAMYIARKFTQKGLHEIAKQFDKSHATILHGVKSIEKRLDVEPELKQSVDEILHVFGYSIEDKV